MSLLHGIVGSSIFSIDATHISSIIGVIGKSQWHHPNYHLWYVLLENNISLKRFYSRYQNIIVHHDRHHVWIVLHIFSFCCSDHYFTKVSWQDESHVLVTWTNRAQTSVVYGICDAVTADCHLVNIHHTPKTCLPSTLRVSSHSSCIQYDAWLETLRGVRQNWWAATRPGIDPSHKSRNALDISHNAPFCDRNVHICAHFCYKMVHCGTWITCIVGFAQRVYCQSWKYIATHEKQHCEGMKLNVYLSNFELHWILL